MSYERKPLPNDLRLKAVRHLRDKLHPVTLKEVREAHEKDPEKWWAGFHMFGGMAIRNLLRDVIKDDELPGNKWSGEDGQEYRNWDDYYIEVLEEAAGV